MGVGVARHAPMHMKRSRMNASYRAAWAWVAGCSKLCSRTESGRLSQACGALSKAVSTIRRQRRIIFCAAEYSSALVALVLGAVIITLAGRSAAATVLMVNPCWVDETVVPSSLDYGATAFGTLTAAIAAAKDGDRILLSQGRYEAPAEQFPIVVDKAIGICSADGSLKTILCGPPMKAVFKITAADVQITGLSIEFSRHGFVVQADRARIHGNRLSLVDQKYMEASCGIWLAGACQVQIVENEFINCGLAIAGPPISDTSRDLPVLTGLFEVGDDSGYFTTHRIEHNLVNGKPLYYLVNAAGVSVPVGVGQVILAGCQDVTVDGLDVSGASVGVEVAYCHKIRVVNVTASDCGLFGVYLCYSNECEVAGVTCSGDTHGLDLRAADCNVVRESVVARCGQGIFLSRASDNLVTECIVYGNGVGVFIGGGKGNHVTSSTITQNDLGISAEDEGALLVTENAISENVATGMRLRNTDCTLYGNVFMENWVGLIAVDSSEITVSKNRMCGHAQCGLYMRNLDHFKITLNQFADNSKNHLEATGSLTNGLIVQNAFIGTQGMVVNSMAICLDLALNWWGTTNPGHIAERCQGAVLYFPFLTVEP